MIVASNGFHHLNPKTLLPLDFMFCPKMFPSCRFASTSPFCPQSGFTPSIFKKFYHFLSKVLILGSVAQSLMSLATYACLTAVQGVTSLILGCLDSSVTASIAQLVERPLLEREVVGLNPAAAPYQRCTKWY